MLRILLRHPSFASAPEFRFGTRVSLREHEVRFAHRVRSSRRKKVNDNNIVILEKVKQTQKIHFFMRKTSFMRTSSLKSVIIIKKSILE